MRYTTVVAAAAIVENYYEASGITCDFDSIYKRVHDWYIHSDITDPEILAACALSGEWHPGTTYQDMLNAREKWFSIAPISEISIWEF